MFLAAFTSRSWHVPHEEQSHSLIPSPAIPFGRSGGNVPHEEQVWDVNFSSTSTKVATLYRSIFRKEDHPASRTDLAIFVLARFFALTLPIATYAYSRARRLESLW